MVSTSDPRRRDRPAISSPGGREAVHPRHADVHAAPRRAGAAAPDATASAPSAASPTTSMSGWRVEDRRRSRPRTSAWSSTTTTGSPAGTLAPYSRAPSPAAARPRTRQPPSVAVRPGAGRRRPRPARACPTSPCPDDRAESPASRPRRAVVGDLDGDPAVAAGADPQRRQLRRACLSTLVSASWTTPVGGQVDAGRQVAAAVPSTQHVDVLPGPLQDVDRAGELGQTRLGRARRSSRRRRAAGRAAGAGRSTASRPVSSTADSAGRAASSGSAPAEPRRPRPAPPSPTTAWATTSCSSRAIRARSSSSSARSRASRSRSAPASASASCARWLSSRCTSRPSPQARPNRPIPNT